MEERVEGGCPPHSPLDTTTTTNLTISITKNNDTMINLPSRRRWLVVFLYFVCQLNGLELRRTRILRTIRGGYENEDYFDGNYGLFRPPPEAEPEEEEEVEEEKMVPQVQRYKTYESPIPVYVSSGGGGLVTLVMALTATLAGGVIWLLKTQGRPQVLSFFTVFLYS